MLDEQTLVTILAPLIALGFTYLVFQKGGKALLGPEFSFWNPLRRALIPVLDTQFGGRFGKIETSVRETEYAATIHAPLDEIESWLAEDGAYRLPLASVASTPDGRTETSSWTWHKAWSRRQLHPRTFVAHPDRERDGVLSSDVYVHEEPAAAHPFTAAKHYRGEDINHALGVDMFLEKLRESPFEEGEDYEVLPLDAE